ncbi:WD40 repeat domain-containing protein [Actinokineospora inagensis]|uniref:WD40 repeat domain-containing protein n=1 Tax=Actinokineospora inagensis TaxID=103730 RepID=UPI0004077089|nr:hypothetical protein [Actinokineospora inagensis]
MNNSTLHRPRRTTGTAPRRECAITSHDGAVLTLDHAGVIRRKGDVRATLAGECAFLCSSGPIVLTGGAGGVLLNALTAEPLHRLPVALTSAAAFPGHAVVGTEAGEAVIFAVDVDQVRAVDTVRAHDTAIADLTVAGGVLIALATDGAIARYDLTTLELFDRITDTGAHACIALPDNRFATVGADLRLWSESEVVAIPAPHPLTCAAVTTDGMVIAAGSATAQVALYDLPTRRWSTVETTAPVTALHYADGSFLAADGTVRHIPAVPADPVEARPGQAALPEPRSDVD